MPVNNADFYNDIKEKINTELKSYFVSPNACTINFTRKIINADKMTLPIIRYAIVSATKDPATKGDRCLGKYPGANKSRGSFHYLMFNLVVTCTVNTGGEKKRDQISSLLHQFAIDKRSTFGQYGIKEFDISTGTEIMTDPLFFENLHVMTCKYLFYDEV